MFFISFLSISDSFFSFRRILSLIVATVVSLLSKPGINDFFDDTFDDFFTIIEIFFSFFRFSSEELEEEVEEELLDDEEEELLLSLRFRFFSFFSSKHLSNKSVEKDFF